MSKRKVFRWQERTWTCGPAALRHALSGLGIEKTEKYLARVLNTTRLRGTKNRDFVKVAKHFNLKFVVEKNSSIGRLGDLIGQGYKIIVCYFSKINDSGHYAVVEKIGKNLIYLDDPSLGPRIKYTKSYFSKIWWSQYDEERKWFIAMKK